MLLKLRLRQEVVGGSMCAAAAASFCREGEGSGVYLASGQCMQVVMALMLFIFRGFRCHFVILSV